MPYPILTGYSRQSKDVAGQVDSRAAESRKAPSLALRTPRSGWSDGEPLASENHHPLIAGLISLLWACKEVMADVSNHLPTRPNTQVGTRCMEVAFLCFFFVCVSVCFFGGWWLDRTSLRVVPFVG